MHNTLFRRIFAWGLIALLASTGLAQAEPRLGLGQQTALPGEQVTLSLNFSYGDAQHPALALTADSVLSALACELHFDASQLEFISAKSGPAAGNKQLVTHELAPGRLRLGLISFDKSTLYAGEVALLTFAVAAKATPGMIHIQQRAEGSTPAGRPVAVAGQTGLVEVVR